MTGSSSFGSDTHQVTQLAAELRAAGHELAELEPVTTEAGRVVLRATRPPRRSGALAASLRADTSRQGVAFASTARYWSFVHWGAPRRHVRARPFFVEALHTAQDRVVAVYAAHVSDTIRKVH